jgi:hypothetical protein
MTIEVATSTISFLFVLKKRNPKVRVATLNTAIALLINKVLVIVVAYTMILMLTSAMFYNMHTHTVVKPFF